MIPVSIPAGLLAFQAALIAAQPLKTAPALQVAALVAQGRVLLMAIDTALTAAAGGLDAPDPAGYPSELVTGLMGLSTAADDQTTLSDMRGFVGRAVLNLAQASV